MLENISPEEFNAFSKNHEQGLFYQSSYWGELKKSTGWEPHFVAIKKDYDIAAAALLLAKKIPVINKYIFYSPRGFLINYKSDTFIDDFSNQVFNYVKKNKGIFIKINPYVEYQKRDIDGNIVSEYNNQAIIDHLTRIGFKHNGFTITYGTDLEPRWLSVLDLKGKTEQDVLNNMRATARNNVIHSYKYGLKLIEADESRLEDFKKLMEHTSERRGFVDRSLDYYKAMYNSFKKDDYIKVMLVELDLESNIEVLKNSYNEVSKKLEFEKSKPKLKENVIKEYESQLESFKKKIEIDTKLKEENGSKVIIAGGLFMTFGHQVVSLFGASYKEFMNYKAQYFLNFEMIKYALNNGYDKYNFFGITGEFNKESEMYGLFDYKRSFGAEVVELIGEFTYVTNKFYNFIYKIMYKMYRKTKR